MIAPPDKNSSSPGLFEAAEMSFGYTPESLLLAGVNLSVSAGDFLGIIGPNGAGKTTLLRLLTGWLKPTGGEVRFRGRRLAEWGRREFAREVALVPQSEETTLPFSVKECILMGRYAHQDALVGFEDEEDHAIARGVLSLVDLDGFGPRQMSSLSGGERQRVLVARALAQCPSVIILDEPTSSLDPAHQRDLFNLLARLNRDHGLTVITVTHDLNLAARYCERIAMVAGGGIARDGTRDEALDPSVLRGVFGIEMEVVVTPSGQRLYGWKP